VSGDLASFLSVEIEHQIPFFTFSFIFVTAFIQSYRWPESLSRSDAQYCHVVTVLTRV